MSFHPYLFFGGNCRQAFTRYQEVFGGELVLLTAADLPEGEQMPGAAKDAIMHAALMMDGSLLMGSDDPTTDSFGPVQGMQVNFATPDASRGQAGLRRPVGGRQRHRAPRPDVVVARVRHAASTASARPG